MEPNLFVGRSVGDDAKLNSESEKNVVRERYQLPVDCEIVCEKTCDNQCELSDAQSNNTHYVMTLVLKAI